MLVFAFSTGPPEVGMSVSEPDSPVPETGRVAAALEGVFSSMVTVGGGVEALRVVVGVTCV